MALKELAFAEVPSTVEIDLFHREAEVLRGLRHPRIPSFHESFVHGEGVGTRLYLAQEWIGGRSLLEVSQKRRLSEDECLDLLEQMLEVICYLQEQTPPVVHRDVKPSNIIRKLRGELALVDFGIVRELARGKTHGATLVGTFGYMPLEQLGGTVDKTSDVYALGATVLHLLTGHSPADLFTPSSGLRVPADLRVSRKFRKFLEQLIAKDPSDRFPVASVALEYLKENLKQRALNEKRNAPRRLPRKSSPGRSLRSVQEDHGKRSTHQERAFADFLEKPTLEQISLIIPWVIAAAYGIAAVVIIILGILGHY